MSKVLMTRSLKDFTNAFDNLGHSREDSLELLGFRYASTSLAPLEIKVGIFAGTAEVGVVLYFFPLFWRMVLAE